LASRLRVLWRGLRVQQQHATVLLTLLQGIRTTREEQASRSEASFQEQGFVNERTSPRGNVRSQSIGALRTKLRDRRQHGVRVTRLGMVVDPDQRAVREHVVFAPLVVHQRMKVHKQAPLVSPASVEVQCPIRTMTCAGIEILRQPAAFLDLVVPLVGEREAARASLMIGSAT
jgi:hypothetical protein